MPYLTGTAAESFGQFVVVLFCFVGILALTYFTTRWVAGYQKAKVTGQNLQVLETLRLANNKYLQLVKAGEKTYYVLAIGKDEISLIGTLSEEDLQEGTLENYAMPPVSPSADFKEILSKMKETLPKGKKE